MSSTYTKQLAIPKGIIQVRNGCDHRPTNSAPYEKVVGLFFGKGKMDTTQVSCSEFVLVFVLCLLAK